MINESTFVRYFVKYLKNCGFFIQRIESGMTGRGIPDLFCITDNGIPMWVEFKEIGEKINKINWRVGQQEWLHRCWCSGVKTYTLIRREKLEYILVAHNEFYKMNTIPAVPHLIFQTGKQLVEYWRNQNEKTEETEETKWTIKPVVS